MNISELHNLVSSGQMAIALEKLSEALRPLENVSSVMAHNGVAAGLARRIELLHDDYARMLDYFRQGGKDSTRAVVLSSMRLRAHDVADDIFFALIRNGLDATARMRSMANHVNVAVADLVAQGDVESLVHVLHRQKLSTDDVNCVLSLCLDDATARWSNSDAAFVVGALARNLISRHNRAIALGFLSFLASPSVNDMVEARIVVGLVADMIAHSARWTEDDVLPNALVSLLENRPTLASVFRWAVWAIIQTQVTDSISSFLRDKISSEMSKIANKLKDVSDGGTFSISSDDLKEIFGEDGDKVIDKFDRIAKWQQSGADVAYASYKHLKTDSFFRDEVNWLRPLSADVPEVKAIVGKLGNAVADVVATLRDSHIFCESDKFSMIFSLDVLQVEDLQALNEQFRKQTEQMNEFLHDSVNDGNSCVRVRTTAFVHDLYRVAYASSFSDSDLMSIFTPGVAVLLQSPVGRILFPTAEEADALGRDAVDCEVWTEAASIYAMRAESDMSADAVWQRKYALCLLQTGNKAKAIKALKRADIIDADNTWTKLKLAEAYYDSIASSNSDEALSNARSALYYLQSAAEIKKLSTRQKLMLAECLALVGNHSEALALLYEVEYDKPGRTDVARSIANLCMDLGKTDDASKFFSRIPDAELSDSDLRMMVVLALVQGDNPRAVSLMQRVSVDARSLLSDADKRRIVACGANPVDFLLVAESSLFSF